MNIEIAHKNMIRLLALLAPLFTMFWPIVYDHPDLRERKIIQRYLVGGLIAYAAAGYFLFIT